LDELELPRPNDSLEVAHFARHAAHSDEFDFDDNQATEPPHIPLASPSSPKNNNATTFHPNNSKHEERIVTRLPRVTVETQKQEDVPLPTIAPLNPETLQRIR
jgi:hypothetical protein